MWGPNSSTANLLASGSIDGETSFLRINRYNVHTGLEQVGCSISPAKFVALDWVDSVDEAGIMAGGMEDGAIMLWNPKKVMESYS